MFSSAGFVLGVLKFPCNRSTVVLLRFFFLNLSFSGRSRVGSLFPVKSRKSMAHDVIYTCATYAGLVHDPQWGAADAQFKVPSGKNTELKMFSL